MWLDVVVSLLAWEEQEVSGEEAYPACILIGGSSGAPGRE